MFEAFTIPADNTPFLIGKVIGYILSFACCLGVIIVPIVLLIRNRKGGTGSPQQFYIYKNGQRCGPYTVDNIRGLLSTGELQLSDQAWYQNAWVPLSSIPEIVGSQG